MEMNILWLYPDKMNLHGDRGNMMAMANIADSLGIKLNIIRANTAAEAGDISKADLIYIGPGQMDHMKKITDDLRTIEAEIKAYAESGGHFLIIGSSGCMLSKNFTRYDGSVEEGLGILDMTAKELNRTKMPYVTREVYGDDILFRMADGMEIVGCQIQCMDFNLKNVQPLGKVLYGYGNNTMDATEGARYKNVIFTNTVGPLFSLNPWFAVRILSEIGEKNGGSSGFDENCVSYMDYARESIKLRKQFIKEKHKLPGICAEV
ncbi:MAG: hypothetical protein ACI4JN_07660 [Ruminococcus sp.]